MNDREKFLAAIVAAVVILWSANLGWDKYHAALKTNRNQQQNVAQALSAARTATARGVRAQEKLHQWQRQSLPTDPDIARSLYQDWLQQQLTTAGLQVQELNIRSPRSGSTQYQQFSFVVRATGKLGELTDFLYRFYQAKHLHRISKTTLLPTEDRTALIISLTIDALSLAEADRKNQLAEGTLEPFKQTREQFRETIVGRNLFATYQALKVPESEEEKSDQEATQAKFSGIHYGQEGWQMSVRMNSTGKVLYYREGDTLEIGQWKGTIKQLDGNERRAVLLSASGRQQIRLGQTLAEAEPLGDEPILTPTKPD